MASQGPTDDRLKRAQDAIKTYALSMYAILGHPAPDEGRLGQMASHALPFLSPSDLNHPEKPNLAALGQLQQMVLADIGANRPRNEFSAEAARAAQAAGGADGYQRGAGFGYVDAIRAGNSSARFNEMARESARRGGSAEAAAASGYASAASLNYVGAGNFGGTPFAAAGMNYATFAYVRGQDRALTGQNLLHAVDDAGKLGFGANDKEAIRDHAVIDHYSRDARAANEALRDYRHRLGEDAELKAWRAQAAETQDAAQRAALKALIDERRAQHRRESGVQDRIDNDAPKAGAAMRRRANRLDMQGGEDAALGQMQKRGTDNVRDADFTKRDAALSHSDQKGAVKAATAQVASSGARQESKREASSHSRWAKFAAAEATALPEQQPSPTAEAAKPATDKPAEPKKLEPTLPNGKDDTKTAPAKPAAPPRTRMAGAVGPSVG